MSQEAYELLAMGARYWFALLGVIIVWRSYVWLVHDARAHRRELRDLPDAGLVGEVVNLQNGRAYPLPYECILGSGRGCDVRIKGAGLKRRHISMLLVRGKGLRVTPVRGAEVALNGEPLFDAQYALHGARIQTPECSLRVRLFAGLPVPRRNAYQEVEQAPVMQAMQAEYPFEPADEEYPFEETAMPYFPPPVPDILPQPPVNAPDTDEEYPFDAPEMGAQETWPYAPYPPELLAQAEREQEAEAQSFVPQERHRRAGRRRRG